MADIFHTSDGCAWDLPGISGQELENEDLNVLIISVIEKNLPPSTWVEYTKYSRSNLLQVLAYLLSSTGPTYPTEAKLGHMRSCVRKWDQNLRDRPIYTILQRRCRMPEELRMQNIKEGVKSLDIPNWDTFCNTVQNAALPVVDESAPSPTSLALTAEAAAIETLEISGYLTRPDLTGQDLIDSQVADRTMLVPLYEEAWMDDEENWTTHLHLSRTFGFRASHPRLMKVEFFRGMEPVNPSIAITFLSTEKRNAAMRAFSSFNLREGAVRINVRKHQQSEDEKTIWSVTVGETNFHGLRDWVLDLLPHGTYIPSYGLTEELIESRSIFKLQIKDSPIWLKDMLPTPGTDMEWRLTNANRESCLACRQFNNPSTANVATSMANTRRARKFP
ncbi:MAG: hypothetical protein L6R42_004262 [Xanthoria sp. 1 TBL-2021]|nr:MAG: hypothetical protein L6R42_004262 [Xanthoria sp. 1 TBL-2021]